MTSTFSIANARELDKVAASTFFGQGVAKARQRLVDRIDQEINPYFVQVYSDWRHLYFEINPLYGIRIARDGTIATAGSDKISAHELIYFLLKHDDIATPLTRSWALYARALRVFLDLPLPDVGVVSLKEIVLVTDASSTVLASPNRHLPSASLVQERETSFFDIDEAHRAELAEYIDDQENPWYWSIQYVMSDGTVLNPLAAHLHPYGFCLPKNLVLPKTSKDETANKSYWLFQGNEYAAADQYYRDITCALNPRNAPIRLTAQMDWQSDRQFLEVQSIKRLPLAAYAWALQGTKLSVNLGTSGSWIGLNMEWAFDPANAVLAYHPGHQVAALVNEQFQNAFTSPHDAGSQPTDFGAPQRLYQENRRRRMEVAVQANGSLQFDLKRPRYTLIHGLTGINAALSQAGNSQGVHLERTRRIDRDSVRYEYNLSPTDPDVLTWSYQLAVDAENLITGPGSPIITLLIRSLNAGIEAFAGMESIVESKRGVRRSHDLKLVRHRGVARCLMAEVATFYVEPGLLQGQTLKTVAMAVHKKVEALFAVISGNYQSSLSELCSPKAIGHLRRVTERLLKPCFAPSDDIVEHHGQVYSIDMHYLIMPFFSTLLGILARQHGHGAFLKNGAKSLQLSIERDDTNPLWLRVFCQFSRPIPMNRLTNLPRTTVKIDGLDLEEVTADDLIATFVLDDKQQRIDWFDLHPQVFFKGQELAPEVAQKFSTDGIVKYCGKYYLLDRSKVPSAKWLAYFWKRLQSAKRKSFDYRDEDITRQPPSEVLGILALMMAGMPVAGGERWQKIAASFAALCQRGSAEPDMPSASPPVMPSAEPPVMPSAKRVGHLLNLPLKPFQQAGVQWLLDLHGLGLGGILADDMGLGKTIQTIGFLRALQLRDELGSTLVVMPPSLVHNWLAEIKKFAPSLPVAVVDARSELPKLRDASDKVILTTYGLLYEHGAKFRKIAWNVAIFDEAQYLKNIRSKRTCAARDLRAAMKICLSGTPLENHYGEFYSLIDLVVPGALGEYSDFAKTYVQTGGKIHPLATEDIEFLRLKTLPLVMRRSKQAILTELPAKTETVLTLPFDKEQKKIYRDTAIAWNEKIGQLIEDKGDKQAQLQMLTALLRLRQICSCPDMIANVEYARVPPKFERLKEALTELADKGEPVIVFTNFRTTLEKLEAELRQAGIFTLSITGKTPTRHRGKILEQFAAASGHVVLLMTQKVGGVGLNLTKASYVFHLEPWWNPQVEIQATDRVYRIGQTRHVHVYRYIMEHSVEERIQQLKASKYKIFRDLLDGDDIEPGKVSFAKQQLSQSDFAYLLNFPNTRHPV